MYGALSYLSYVIFRVAMQATSRGGDNSNGEGGGRGAGGLGFPLCNNAALKLYCESSWVP